MQDNLQPLIHKAAVLGLRINVTRTGLCINDPAELHLLPDGQIGIYALARKRFMGLLRPKSLLHLGNLGPAASALVLPALQDARHLRVRIVGLTPEHLSPETGAEVWVSVWGDAKGLVQRHPAPEPEPPGLVSVFDQPSGSA